MNASAEAADQIVRMSLNGVEIAAKISGKAADVVCGKMMATTARTSKRAIGRNK